MSEKMKWRFPLANYGSDKGLSTGDKEAFKQTPYKTFAREILQNSIDVAASDEEPVIVEFKGFKIKTKDIPDVDSFVEQVNLCKEYWKSNPDVISYCDRMLNSLKEEEIDCLRISDFNTTGATGVHNHNYDSPFFAMTKGSGHSVKPGIKASGGSKGMGKNAAFLMSYLEMIIYSTVTKDEKGSLGVANLVTGFKKDSENDEKRDYSQGPGYYSIDDCNSPTSDLLNYDKDYNRNDQIGTDLFIIGFKNNKSWKENVINSVLDSFMVAIYYNKLNVIVEDIEINKDTIEDIINSNLIDPKIYPSLISQFELLEGGEEVRVFDIETEYGAHKLYVKVYDNDSNKASHVCDLIRYPYMKIKHYDYKTKSFPISAMFIIGEGELSKKLLSIENPKHDNWETQRIEDLSLRKEVKDAIDSMKQQIEERISECLHIDNDGQIDPLGADEFLPSTIDEGKGTTSGEDKKEDSTTKATVGQIKYNKTTTNRPVIEIEDGDGVQPDIGKVEEGEKDDGLLPSGENKGNGGEPHGDNPGEVHSGDNIILRNTDGTNIKYKLITLGKDTGKYRLIFISPCNEENCYLSIKILDDMSKSVEKANIIDFEIDGVEVASNDHVEYGPFKIKKSAKHVCNLKLDIKEYFGSEVVIICK